MEAIFKYTRLQNILNSMVVPKLRKDDFKWLLRNLEIYNSHHPQYEEAINLIKELMKLNKEEIEDIKENI